MLRWILGITGVIVLCVSAYAISLRPHAPPLHGDTDGAFAGGVVTLETIMLNGAPQWISVRGRSPTLPKRWPHAYVGATQQVSVQETDSLGWALTLVSEAAAVDSFLISLLSRP